MSEYEAYTQLIMMIGLVISVPFFIKTCLIIGKFLALYLFPPKYLTVEVTRVDGTVEVTKVKIDDNKALVEALLKSTGRVIS